MRYFAPELNNTEFGLFYLNYHSRVPVLSGISVTNSNANSARYFAEYPEDIELYGFSGYLTIDESFYKELILLQHQSHLFFNALTAKHIQFDITNRVCIRFFKYLQLRLETSLMYFPDQSLQLQYRQEVLLGIFYEHRK